MSEQSNVKEVATAEQIPVFLGEESDWWWPVDSYREPAQRL